MPVIDLAPTSAAGGSEGSGGGGSARSARSKLLSLRRIASKYDRYVRSVADLLAAAEVRPDADLVPDTDRDAACLLSCVTFPGQTVMLRLRQWMLKFAADHAWVLTGGWAQHLALADADPSASSSLYDVSSACTMSDVDAYSTNALQDLVRAAAAVHGQFGLQATVNCGMKPDTFRLSVTTGHGSVTLVDMTGISQRMLGLLRVRDTELVLPSFPRTDVTTRIAVRYTDPVHEVARMFKVVDNVYELHLSNLTSRLDRCARIESAARQLVDHGMSTSSGRGAWSRSRTRSRSQSQSKHQQHTPTLSVSQLALDSALQQVIEDHPELTASFAVLTVPGCTVADVLVCGSSGVALLHALLARLPRAEFGAVNVYAPCLLILPHILIAEITGAAAATTAITVFVLSTPVPMAPGSAYNVSARYALAHLYASALWRRANGDDVGHDERFGAFLAGLNAIGARGGLPARHAGTPADTEFVRYIRWRTLPHSTCRITYQTPVANSAATATDPDAFVESVRKRGVPGAAAAPPFPLEGQLIGTFSPAELCISHQHLTRALAAVVPRNFMTDIMDLPWPQSATAAAAAPAAPRRQHPGKKQQKKKKPAAKKRTNKTAKNG